MPGSTGAGLAAIAICVAALTAADAGAVPDCAVEAGALTKEEAELPKLEVAPPADRPITCITLETVIDFAKRVKTHFAHCPQSAYSADAASWEETRTDYSKRFTHKRCRRTLLQ
jgi:hypothetical protein